VEARAAVVAYCRGGFEPEAAADLRRLAAAARADIEVASAPGAGFVSATTDHTSHWAEVEREHPPIFARSIIAGIGSLPLPAATATGGRADRVTPLLDAIERLAEAPHHAPPWHDVWVEYPDTNDGKALSTLARALGPRLQAALRARGRIAPEAGHRLHVFLAEGARAWIGTRAAGAGDWPMGIPRLAMPRDAPSRSTLKLAEAFATFLGARQGKLLRPGLHAVDLGAAPGGWTWQLARHGLHVVAVDNGALKGSVVGNPLVTHVRDDGFRWRPHKAVDWVVCDIVDQPIHIAELMAHWIAEGWARRAIFNLKLPMKKRFDEVQRCEQRIGEILRRARRPSDLRVRQLYHDREEVTAYLAPAS
jgi:23S rRNA (cytidine2498-2'-O)-methyltransferase